MTDKKVVHLLSGGMDSVVLLNRLLELDCSVHCVFFSYGQNHKSQELKCARFHASFRGVPLIELSLPKINGSTLTGGVGTKVVPNRNAIFISTAISVAVNLGCEVVTIGCNQDDAADFPDCRKEFIDAINGASQAAGTGVYVEAPFLESTKRDVANLGKYLGVHMESTYSCYAGGELPCGVCDACLKRAEAIL